MQFLLHFMIITTCTLPSVLGLHLILGRGKVLHFGPLAVSIAGAYGIFVPLIQWQTSYPVAILCGLVCAVAVAEFLAVASLRLSQDGFGVLSLAVHMALLSVVLNWQSVTRGALGIPGIPRFAIFRMLETQFSLSAPVAFLVVCVTVVAAWTALIWSVDRGAFGRALQALSEQEWYAASLGISRVGVRCTIFFLAACSAVLTSVLYHQYLFLLHPSDFSFSILVFLVSVIIAGRPGSLRGAVVALVLLSMLREGIRFLPIAPDLVGPVRLFLFGIILLGTVWQRRDTLFPPMRRL